MAEVNLTSLAHRNQESVPLCVLVVCNRERCGRLGY